MTLRFAPACARSSGRGRHLPDDAELVRFDFEKPESWGRAFEDIDALFLVRPPEIARVHRHITPAIDAAERVGVEHVVFLSVLGAEKNPLLPHRRIGRHLQGTDLTYTFLRASFFMQNFYVVHRVDVPRTRVYDAADDLHDRGLVDVKQSSTQRYWAISTETAGRHFEQEYDHRVTVLADALDQFASANRSTEQQGVWTVTGRDTVTDRVVDFIVRG